METKAQRQRAVAFALALTENTHLAPGAYERLLLEKYVQGELSLAQVEERLARLQ